MASNTNNLGLLKKDPVADGNDTFNIRTMLNENWDKIDEFAGKTTPISRGGTGANNAEQALANLGGIAVGAVGNLHVWERVQTYAEPVPEVPAGYTLGETLNKVVLYTNYNSDDAYRSITCYESLTVAKDGTISGANSSSYTIYYSRSNSTLPSSIGGKFLYENPGSTAHTNAKYTDQWWYIPTDVEILTGTGATSDGESSTRWMGYSKLQRVTGYPYTPAIPAGTTTDYLTSTDRDAYTDGTVDSTTITYLGQLGGGARIEVGSYVGTGTYGSSNKNSITCAFEPKLLVVHGKFGSDSSRSSIVAIPMVVSSGKYYFMGGNSFSISGTIVLSGNTVSFYSTNNAYYQGNIKGNTYYYTAIG